MTTPQPPQEPSDRDQLPQYPPPPSAPVRVKLPQIKPLVSYVIIGVTVVVFLLQLASEQLYGADLPAFFGMKINEFILAGQYWRLFTSALLHADIMHIGFNMYAIFILGREIERFYGHLNFLILYFIGAFAGGVFSFLFTDAPSLGASTATFGLLAAYGVLAFNNRHIFGQQSNRILRNVGQVAVINLIIGLSPGIDNWGHLGGLLGGAALAWFGGPVLRMAGTMTDIHLENKRSSLDFYLTAAVVFVLFAFAALMLGFR